MTGEIPLTVLGGYLGAGKTTLLNRVLTADHRQRIAVIVNDFGDVAIDEALIESESGNVRALANGCVCCSAVDGLAMALREITALDPRPDHVVIEVSGVGDPWAVAQWGRTPGFTLESVLVVVDPESIEGWLDDRYVGETVAAQIAAADVLILSRTDVVEPAVVDAARARVELISAAPFSDGLSGGAELLLPTDRIGRAAIGSHVLHVAHSFVPSVLGRDELRSWLESAPDAVVRVKGVVDDGDTGLVGQRSGHRVEVTRRRGTGPMAPAVTAIARPCTDPGVLREWSRPVTA